MPTLQELFQAADKTALSIIIGIIILLVIFYFYNFKKPKGKEAYIEKKLEHNKSIIEAMSENAWSIDEIKKMMSLTEIDKAPWIDMNIEALSLPCPFTPGKKIKDTHFLYYDKTEKKWHMMLIKGILGFFPKNKQKEIIALANPNYSMPSITNRVAFEISYYCKKGKFSNSKATILRCFENNEACYRFNSDTGDIFLSKGIEDELVKKNVMIAVERMV